MARFKAMVVRMVTFGWVLVETLQAFAARARNFAAVLIASALLSSVAAAQVPEVIGPIPALGPPGTDVTHNYPQLASAPNFDRSSRGYIEVFQGTATQYQVPPIVNGRVTSTGDATVLSTGNPYKTGMLVRRPANPDNFNGVVLVEWVNVTSGYDLDANWRDYLTRAGMPGSEYRHSESAFSSRRTVSRLGAQWATVRSTLPLAARSRTIRSRGIPSRRTQHQ